MPRALVLDGPRCLRLADQEARPLRQGEVRTRARLSAISHGTELNLYRGTSAFTDRVFDRGLRAFVAPPAGRATAYPVTLGYEARPARADARLKARALGPEAREVADRWLFETA